MPEIRKIQQTTHNDKEGFIVVWEMIGFQKSMARFRAIGMTAMRFPTTITEVEVVSVTEFEPRDYNIEVFVPTEGFPSAGISSPVDWLKEQFDSDILSFGGEN